MPLWSTIFEIQPRKVTGFEDLMRHHLSIYQVHALNWKLWKLNNVTVEQTSARLPPDPTHPKHFSQALPSQDPACKGNVNASLNLTVTFLIQSWLHFDIDFDVWYNFIFQAKFKDCHFHILEPSEEQLSWQLFFIKVLHGQTIMLHSSELKDKVVRKSVRGFCTNSHALWIVPLSNPFHRLASAQHLAQ